MNEWWAAYYLGVIAGVLMSKSGLLDWFSRITERGCYAFARWIVGLFFDWQERRQAKERGYFLLGRKE